MEGKKVSKKVTSKKSKKFYGRIGKKEELQIVGICDTSFNTDEKAVWEVFLLLVNQNLTKASPIYWKTEQIERVCYSPQDFGFE